jgi:hypothetical protein
MSTEQDIRLLKHQVTLMNAALHALIRSSSDEQKILALSEFESLSQYAQAHLEASNSSEQELSFFVSFRKSLEQAMSLSSKPV